jgi:hypothetical protein
MAGVIRATVGESHETVPGMYGPDADRTEKASGPEDVSIGSENVIRTGASQGTSPSRSRGLVANTDGGDASIANGAESVVVSRPRVSRTRARTKAAGASTKGAVQT